jgi:hypothetical protein
MSLKRIIDGWSASNPVIRYLGSTKSRVLESHLVLDHDGKMSVEPEEMSICRFVKEHRVIDLLVLLRAGGTR